MNIEQLRKLLHEKLDKAKELISGAEKEERNLNEIENVDYQKLVKEADEIKSQITTMEKAYEIEESEARTVEHAQPKKKVWEDFGEFLGAVMRSETRKETDPRLVETRQSGLNEGVPSEGGFLVPTDHSNELVKKVHDTSVVSSRARKVPVKGNGLTINTINETSRATGSRWGGVKSYWLHEAGTKTASKPDFGRMELKLKKLIGLCYATDELLEDTTALDSIVTEAFTEDFAWMVDNALIRGTGAGNPLGVLNAPCLVTVNPEAGQPNTTFVYENAVNMWARMWSKSRSNAVWFINQDLEPQLHTMSLVVGVGGVPVYMPASGASGSPYASLFGRPVVPIEQCSTLGAVGDVILADYSQYLMIDKAGIKKDVSIHVQFVYDETAFRFVYRCDGQPMWNSALTPANGTNTLSPFVTLAGRP